MRDLKVADLTSQRAQRFMNVLRRLSWIHDGLTPKKFLNAAHAALAFATKSEASSRYPAVLKVDLSPLCNLSCPVCVHAAPGDNPVLREQRFEPHQRMTTEQFQRIATEVAGYTCAASLYYLGDPLTHPDLDDICRIARAAALNVHVSSNFSFTLSDARIRSLLMCGITHLTVCVDGLTQETYARTRIGGRLERVLDNLRRLTAFKAQLRLERPRIEVQFLKFKHNEHEVDAARAHFRQLGVDQTFVTWGAVHNYTELDVVAQRTGGPLEEGLLPRCWWPYASMLIRYDGDVIPCCSHRMGDQYAHGGATRALGSVFERGVAAVWSSPAYSQARRMTVSPKRAERRAEAAGSFCEGCSRLYVTNRAELWRSGRDHAAPQLVTLRRRPARSGDAGGP